jgi:glutamyl-Q tRNA(Asp) synthetase
MVQSTRHAAYEARWTQLQASGLAYPCACTRKDIELAHRRKD